MTMTLRRSLILDIKRIPTDGSGTGTLRAYRAGAPDEEPLLDKNSLFSSRERLALRWNHATGEPEDAIGEVFNFRWLGDDFLANFTLDLENERAVKLYGQLLRDVPYEVSVSFTGGEADVYKNEADGLWHMRKAELLEISIVHAGANRQTAITSIKSASDANDVLELSKAINDMREKGATPEMINDFVVAFAAHEKPAPAARTPESDKEFMARLYKEHPSAAFTLTALAQREAEARATEERRVQAVRDMDARSQDLLGAPPTQLVLDAQMRPLVDEQGDREARAERRFVVVDEGVSTRVMVYELDRPPNAEPDPETVRLPVVGKPDKDEFVGVETRSAR